MKRPPGPRGREALGFLGRGNTSRTLTFLEQTARRFGPISYFRFLNQQIYLVDDPTLIQEILVTRQHSFRRDNGATLLRELVGDGLLTRDEPRHRERRRLMQPAFHRAQIAAYADAMVEQADRVSGEWEGHPTIDIGAEMKRLTLAIVGTCLFGTDFTTHAAEIARVLQRVLKRSSRIAPFVAFLEPWMQRYRRVFPHGPSLFYHKERAQLERILAPVIGQHRSDHSRSGSSGDLLSLLIAARDEQDGKLDDEDLGNEVVTLVLAGHETTATALTWAWYLIASHPEVEHRLHAEVDAILGTRLPAMDDIPRLRYTSFVFAEVLRLYPPALAFGRRPLEPVLLGGYIIPRGASVLVSPYITQRNPKLYDDPLEFRPDRWENLAPPKGAYFPFGAGAKMCIGESFAKLEGVLALAVLSQRWRLRTVADSTVLPIAGVTLAPERPILLRPTPRFHPVTA